MVSASSSSTRRQSVHGFTLIEMLVVLGIVALLATLVAPQVLRYLSKAKTDTAAAQLKNLQGAIELYSFDTGRYPSSDDGLASLLSPPTDSSGWNGPYLRSPEGLQDPWNRAFIYRFPGSHGDYDLFSYGLDGIEGGDGENRDVTSWQSLTDRSSAVR
jgi:general secretion pathway protein G